MTVLFLGWLSLAFAISLGYIFVKYRETHSARYLVGVVVTMIAFAVCWFNLPVDTYTLLGLLLQGIYFMTGWMTGVILAHKFK